MEQSATAIPKYNCSRCAAPTKFEKYCYYCADLLKECAECGAKLKAPDEIAWMRCLNEDIPERQLSLPEDDDEIGGTILKCTPHD